jgi:PHP family Zn ribbon phosphoesterase
MDEYKRCPCGSKKYGYESEEIGHIYICYKCGKYSGKGVHPMLLELTTQDPALLMFMIEAGMLKRIESGK